MKNLWLICDYLCFIFNTNSRKLSKNNQKIIFKICVNLWANLELGTLNLEPAACCRLWANLQENVYSTYKIFFGYKRFIRKNLLFL